MTTRLLYHCAIEATNISCQFLGSVFRRDLLALPILIRLIRISRYRAIREWFNVPFITRIGTINMMKLRFNQWRVPTRDKFPMDLQASWRQCHTVYMITIDITPVDRRVRRPAVGRVEPISVITEGAKDGLTSTITAIPASVRTRGRVFSEIRGQGAIKIRVANGVPIPGIRSFRSYIRNSTITHTINSQARTGARHISFTVFNSNYRHIMAGLMSTLRGFFYPRFRFLFN